MGSLNSAAMNGIGVSPTGPVEGTWCLVVFRDEFKQQPIIIGTIGGIPEEFEDQKVENVSLTPVTSSDGTPVTSSDGTPVTTEQQETPADSEVKRPAQMTLSPAGKAFIESYEPKPLSSAVAGKIAAAEAQVQSSAKSPMTQSMFDATVSMMYSNSSGTQSGPFMGALNGGNYEQAAAQIPSVGTSAGQATTANTNQALKDALGQKESSNNYKAVNQLGYIGKYQMGAAMLTDLGYVKRGTSNSQLSNPSSWTGKDGISSKEAFLANPGVQESAMDAELAMNKQRLIKQGVIGANTPTEEVSGYLATSHLLGTGGAQKLKAGTNGTDANGVSGQTYYNLGVNSARGTTPNTALSSRREAEKKLFMKDGVPGKDGSPSTPSDSSTPQANGQPVDGELQVGNIETVKILTAKGFRDPNEVYPKKDWLNEPDTHRLARHEKIDNTIVLFKDAARVTGVSTALGGSWDQPPIPYNAKYPFNQTRVSESGHVEEWDDTKDNERLHWYHRSGTFEEIDRNGTRVNRIVGDGYEIFERHGHVLIKGHANVTIRGNSLVRVENNAYLQILGDAKTEITGDWSVGVGGDILFHAGGNISMDGSSIYLNSGVAEGVPIPSEMGTMPEFGPLSNPTRLADILANYETPEEGDPSEFNAAQVAAGTLTPADTQPQPPKDPNSPPDPAPPEPKTAPPVTNPGCPGLADDDLKPGLQLSKNFTLGSINAGGSSGIPKPGSVHYGKPATQIVCNQKKLAENVLDPIKAKYPNMTIISAWRSEAVNNSIPGASKTSDHLSGNAADIRLPGFTREQYAQAAADIQKTLPAYNQVILEYKGTGEPWIHVAYVEGANKMESFTADGNTGKKISNGFVVR